jgi:hypothetical protein
MRAITVRQPWAWAIARAGKGVENRSRNIVGSHRGRIAVHAALRSDTPGFQDPRIIEMMTKLHGRDWPLPAMHASKGMIVATANLIDAHHAYDCIEVTVPPGGQWTHRHCSPWADGGCWHIVLDDVAPLDDPIPCRGRLGLWTLPDGLEEHLPTVRPPCPDCDAPWADHHHNVFCPNRPHRRTP